MIDSEQDINHPPYERNSGWIVSTYSRWCTCITFSSIESQLPPNVANSSLHRKLKVFISYPYVWSQPLGSPATTFIHLPPPSIAPRNPLHPSPPTRTSPLVFPVSRQPPFPFPTGFTTYLLTYYKAFAPPYNKAKHIKIYLINITYRSFYAIIGEYIKEYSGTKIQGCGKYGDILEDKIFWWRQSQAYRV